MEITFSEIKEVYENAPQYCDGLTFVWSGTDRKDAKNLFQMLKRNFPDVSVLIVGSSTESKDGKCKKATIKTGKRGRPKTEVQGTKAEKHIHGLVISEHEKIDLRGIKKKITTHCQRARKKNPSLKQQKIKPLKGMDIVQYMDGQSDFKFSCGTFDFDYYLDNRYRDLSVEPEYIVRESDGKIGLKC